VKTGLTYWRQKARCLQNLRHFAIFVSMIFGILLPVESAVKAARPALFKAPSSVENLIHLSFLLTYEGREIDSESLNSIQGFRRRYPDIRFTHLISPAYFLRSKEESDAASIGLKRVIHPGDKVGLYLSPWKSIVLAANVNFRSGPSVWGQSQDNCQADCGIDVPINIYPERDIEKIIKTSIDVLEEHSYFPNRILQVGAWLATPSLLEVAKKLGFQFSFSAVPLPLINRYLGYYPLREWLANLWYGITLETQPHVVATKYGAITEMPLTNFQVDLVSTHDILLNFKKTATSLSSTKVPLHFSLALNQETARIFMPRLESSIREIYEYSDKNGIELSLLDLPVPAVRPPIVKSPNIRQPRVH
jgi:hypothetical protein